MFVEYPNYHYLRLNLMTPGPGRAWRTDPDRMVGMDDTWTNAIDALPTNAITMPTKTIRSTAWRLCTPGFGAGYVTLIFNNSTNIDMVDPGDPIDMEVIYVDTNLFRGRIDIIQSANPLDKYMTLRHIGDFAGVPQNWAFEWMYARADQRPVWPAADASRLVAVRSLGDRAATRPSSDRPASSGWRDCYVRCRYRALDRRHPGTSSAPTGADGPTPVLCEGWIKRVLKAINPFDQRIRDYMNYALNMELSMIQQAGPAVCRRHPAEHGCAERLRPDPHLPDRARAVARPEHRQHAGRACTTA